MKLIYIEWLDSMIPPGPVWSSPRRVIGRELAMIKTVGWLVGETPSTIAIAHSKANDDDVCGAFVIQKGCIKKRRVIGL